MTENYVFQNDKARLNLQLAKTQSNTVISAINFKSPKSRKSLTKVNLLHNYHNCLSKVLKVLDCSGLIISALWGLISCSCTSWKVSDGMCIITSPVKVPLLPDDTWTPELLSSLKTCSINNSHQYKIILISMKCRFAQVFIYTTFTTFQFFNQPNIKTKYTQNSPCNTFLCIQRSIKYQTGRSYYI